jgi:putative lipoic acid-binding regulatory protein
MVDNSRFKELLDQQYQWPALYQFKFICARDQLAALQALLGPTEGLQLKDSAQGKYVSVTFSRQMASSDAVIAVYQSVAVIQGVIAL